MYFISIIFIYLVYLGYFDELFIPLIIFDILFSVSSGMLAGIPGNIFSGPLIQFFGPRTSMLIILSIGIILWNLLAYSPLLGIMYFCRIGTGFLSGFTSVIAQTLVTELSETEIRGLASGLPEMMVAVGLLYAYLLLSFLKWDIATYVCCVPNVLTLLLGFFIPEVRFLSKRITQIDQIFTEIIN